jgi:hypothetical protein
VRKMAHAWQTFKGPTWQKDVTKPADERFTSGDCSIKYVAFGNKTSAKLLLKIGLGYPALAPGFHWLMRIRLGGLTSYKDALACGVPPNLNIKGVTRAAVCPVCLAANMDRDGTNPAEKRSRAELIEHYFLYCRGPLVVVEGKQRRKRQFQITRAELNLKVNIENTLKLGDAIVRKLMDGKSGANQKATILNPEKAPTGAAPSTGDVDTPLEAHSNLSISNNQNAGADNTSAANSQTDSVDSDDEIIDLTVNPVSGAAVCVRPDPISPQWGTDAVIVQALLSGSLSHGKERTRFQQILNLRNKDLSPDLKNTLQGMIGPFWHGNFHSKVPVREACAVLLCRFLISTASSRSKLVWSEWIAKVNAPSTG